MSTAKASASGQTAPSLYVPSIDELTSAISDVLKDSADLKKKPSAKQVQSQLQTNNPNWNIPQRRVAKFLKKQQKEKPAQSQSQQNDDDNASVGSTTSNMRRALSKAVSIRKSKPQEKAANENKQRRRGSKQMLSGLFRKSKKDRGADGSSGPVEEITVESVPSDPTNANFLPPLVTSEDEEDSNFPQVSPVKSPTTEGGELPKTESSESPADDSATSITHESESKDGVDIRNDDSTAGITHESEAKSEAKGEVDVRNDETVVFEKRGGGIYEDDNDGKDEGPCAGCVIL